MNDRSALRFDAEVKERFSFLGDLGFHCVRAESTFVRFESQSASLNVYHGRQSFEIGLEIEPAPPDRDCFSFSEILRLVDREQALHYRNYGTHTLPGVAKGVHQLALLLERCIEGGILKDKQLFSRLRLQREEFRQCYAVETELVQARRKSELAWRNKDYEAFIKALQPLRAALKATEVAKLKFAEKQIRRTGGDD